MNITTISRLGDFFPAAAYKANTVKCKQCSINLYTLLALNPFLQNFGIQQIWDIPQKTKQESQKVDILSLILEECALLSQNVLTYIGNIKFYPTFTNLQNKRVPLRILYQFPRLEDIRLRNCILEGDYLPGYIANLELFNCKTTQRLSSILACAKKLLVAATNVNFQQTFAYLDDLQVYDQDFIVDAFRFPKLQALSLSECYKVGMLQFPSILHLTLMGCSTPCLDLSFMPYLYMVEAHNCGISSIVLPRDVQTVDLSHNSITSFQFSGYVLEQLNLSSNPIREFTVNSAALTSLYLDGCSLSNIPGFDAPQLAFLSIRQNHIECFWYILRLVKYKHLTHLCSDFYRQDLVFQSFAGLQFYNNAKRNCPPGRPRCFLDFQLRMFSRMRYGEEDVDSFREVLRRDRRCAEGYLAWRVFEHQ